MDADLASAARGTTVRTAERLQQQRGADLGQPLVALVDGGELPRTALTSLNTSYENDIVSGRKPLSALKEWRQRWKSSGGDKMRKEYEDSYQRSKESKGK